MATDVRQATVMMQNVAQPGQRRQGETDPPDNGNFHGRILLAVDNENSQRTLSWLLDKMGLQVSHAENGAAAVRHASNTPPDVILIDMQIAELTGEEVVRQIRANGYTRPIIVIKLNDSNDDRRQCLEAGCDDVMSMPVTHGRLYRMLAKYLGCQGASQIDVEPLPSSLCEEGPLFADIVSQFVTRLPEMIRSIETSYQGNAWEKFRELVHNLKGMGGGFGYPQLTEQAMEIEKLMGAGEDAAIVRKIEELHRLTQRIQAGLPLFNSVPDDGVEA